MRQEEVKGVVMAAGKGTRMEPFSYDIPKPLLPIGNIPLIERHITYMKACGIRDIIVVVGHLSFEIARHIGDGASLGVKVKYVEQKENLGNRPCSGQTGALHHREISGFSGGHLF